jgi:prepilin-type N-terminal cleavage/methylation domain-containing protein
VRPNTPSWQSSHPKGFSLLELLVALSIVGILAGISFVSYHIYVKRAKSLEGEIALAEVNRLETLYYQAHSEYSSNLKDIGYNPLPPLKYYGVTVELIGKGSEMTYRAIATPKESPTTDVIVSTMNADGSTSVEKMPALPISVSSGNNVDSGNSPDPTNSTAAGPGSSGGNAAAPPRPPPTSIDPTVMKGGKASD